MSRPWWQHASIYQVYPRSFKDSNGDGTGDLRGVIQELPYLAALGVDAVWLSPFYESPQHDSGYDVANPRSVDPMYGTLNDAKELIAQAHDRGIRIIVDVVPNHASIERDWFKDALNAAPGSEERARFHFLNGRGVDQSEPPNNWMSWFGGSAWTRITEPNGSAGQWYLHTFDSSQPDLNWSNPQIRADGLETLKFWLDLGVDGFRVDVALALMKDMTYPDLDDPEGISLAMRMDLDDGTPESMERRRKVANSPVLDRDEVQDIYREWRALMDSYPGEHMAVAEAWVPPERAARYVAPDTLHQIFNFDFMGAAWDAHRIRTVIDATFDGLRTVQAPATWALSNHDTPRVVTRLGGGKIGRDRARALALIAHALPGAVYIYQGEELGLEDAELPDSARQDPVWFRTNGEQAGRDGARVPMPWKSGDTAYGFSANAKTWLPQPIGWDELSVDQQESDPHSTLHLYRELLHLRKAHPAFANDAYQVPIIADGVLAITRDCGFSCFVNCSEETIELPVAGRVLAVSDSNVSLTNGTLSLPKGTGAWIQV